MKALNFIVILGLAAILAGCETTESKRRDRQLQSLMARTQESSQLYENQSGKALSKLTELQEDYTDLVNRVNQLQRYISTLNSNNQKLQNELAVLKNALIAEQRARQESINKMVEHVAKETANAINSIKRSAPRSNGNNNRPVGKGKFYVYTVQSGATLGAIAKAYKVNISDIKKANKLKNDDIRVGQKLYIPKN